MSDKKEKKNFAGTIRDILDVFGRPKVDVQHQFDLGGFLQRNALLIVGLIAAWKIFK